MDQELICGSIGKMDVEESFEIEHLLLTERKCRSCREVKDLTTDFYKTRKKRHDLRSSYSYECKECTIKRVIISRMTSTVLDKWEYPDW